MAEKFRAMADALVELYHGVNAAPQNVYDSDMETFAIFTKSAINLARQVGCSTKLWIPYAGDHRSRTGGQNGSLCRCHAPWSSKICTHAHVA